MVELNVRSPAATAPTVCFLPEKKNRLIIKYVIHNSFPYDSHKRQTEFQPEKYLSFRVKIMFYI